MPQPKPPREASPELRRLYPGYSDEELLEIEETFERYLDLVKRIYARIQDDPKAYSMLRKELEEDRERRAENQGI